MKHTVIALAMAAAVATATAQSAHTPPTPAQMAQHEVEHYTERLSLTSAQQQEATTIFTAVATSESALRTEEHTAHTALAASIVSGDTATISQAAATLGNIEAERTSAHALAEAKLYKLLTPEQQTSFAAMLNHPMGRGPGPDMGRHGGPPPQ
jgi:Spy/CpxP family protein refolding chaperone